MTKKTLGYVHLEWSCPNCETRNPGPHGFCNGCGAPQPDEVEFQQPAEEQLITDAAEIARAKAGPDVHCPYCNARNVGSAKFCGACGGSLSEAEARASGRVVGAHRDEPAPDVSCPACGTANPAVSRRCSNCGSRLDLAAEPKPEPAVPAAARPRRRIPMVALLGGIALCALVAIVLFSFLFRTEELTAEVASVRWERSVPIEMLGAVERQDWYDEMPQDAQVSTCSQDLRYTSDEPVSNSVEICGTPYTLDTGSGFGEVVQDCIYEVYEDWCTYTVMDWQVFEVVTVSGSDLNPTWPAVNLAGDQRQGEETESYEVTFTSTEGSHTYTARDAAEFSRFTAGSRWILTVNAIGSVSEVQPAR